MSDDALMVKAKQIQRETGWSFLKSWSQAVAEVKAIAPTGGTSYDVNNSDLADQRRDAPDPKLGPPNARVDYSSGERLLALAKQIQAANPGMGFTRAWLQAAAEHPEWTNQTPAGATSNDIDGITVKDVGPKTASIDGFPKLNPNPLSGTVTSVRTRDPHGPA